MTATRVVILGAGSAGCVVAERLSARPDLDVVLLEAGPDYADFSTAPHDVRDNSVLGLLDHDWCFIANSRGVEVRLFRGKIVGGSSAVNATNALRPLESDFDRWVSLGLPEWSWSESLRAFIELEHDEAPGSWHGRGGRVPIRRYADADLGPLQRGFVEAAIADGHMWHDDLNRPGAVGVGPTPMNRDGTTRMTAARTHLDDVVRARPNLLVRPGATVDRLDIHDGQVTAARLVGGERIAGDVFVLCAGSIGSPTILMRSGIGADDLTGHGIVQTAHLPGVGHGLREHPAVMVIHRVDPAALGSMFPVAQTILTASTGIATESPIDLHVIPLTIAPDQFALMVSPVRPLATGRVRLGSAAPEDPPRIDLELFGHDRDLEVARVGVDVARSIAGRAPLAGVLGGEVFPGVSGRDPHALERMIVSAPSLYYHASCTCRMGAASDPAAVVDAFGKLHGVEGAWVIDASIFPDIPSTPTNMATMMLARRCATVLSEQL